MTPTDGKALIAMCFDPFFQPSEIARQPYAVDFPSVGRREPGCCRSKSQVFLPENIGVFAREDTCFYSISYMFTPENL